MAAHRAMLASLRLSFKNSSITEANLALLEFPLSNGLLKVEIIPTHDQLGQSGFNSS
jgi:hypothetical protein